MKLHYIQPRMEVIEMASCENLLQMSEDLGPLSGAEDGTGDDVGTTEKFLNPGRRKRCPFALVSAKNPPHTPREERIHTFKISDVSILDASLILFDREGGESYVRW